MKLSFKELESIAPYSFSSEQELCRSINELVEIFNVKRENISKVYNDDRLVSAYLFFYFATNLRKAPFALDMLSSTLKADMSQYKLIDFGAGPAPTSLAWLSEFSKFSKPIEVIDTAESMLTLAKSNLSTFFPDFNDLKFKAKLEKQSEQTVLCFTHSLNELPEHVVSETVKNANAKYVLVLEPGTKASFRKALALRKLLVSKGYQIEYPCSHAGSCPLEEGDDWCHQYFKLDFDQSIQRLTQLVKRDRKNAPMIFNLYCLTEAKEKQPAIIFRNITEQKYGHEFQICDDNKMLDCLLLKKTWKKLGIDKKELRKILTAGTCVEYTIEKMKNKLHVIDFIKKV